MEYISIQDMLDKAKTSGKALHQFVMEEQAESQNMKVQDIYIKMQDAYDVMCASIDTGLNEKCPLKIEQEDGAKIFDKYVKDGKSIFGDKMGMVIARAMAVSEVNASMGRIVASPTAGSCGILPASLISIRDIYNIKKEDIIGGLFTASAVGMVIANVASIAGATGGCQAECGAAQAMAAASITEILGGDNDKIANAIAIAIQNIEGLVCDPVAGLVECPCIKRNASGAINAILAADMALAGIKSVIPVDDVISAMKQVGDIMDDRLKETAKGGLATTVTGKNLHKKIFG
ncbi:MAG: L-serine ammonia-lyase, iron-sulfur-dependent, subunit alpha [Lachnospiraceae bacterium]|nr:L-serine ammonia-lyase, iron-sulfur-dependent, subunit alpha [Lachnospiraceae bacterium]